MFQRLTTASALIVFLMSVASSGCSSSRAKRNTGIAVAVVGGAVIANSIAISSEAPEEAGNLSLVGIGLASTGLVMSASGQMAMSNQPEQQRPLPVLLSTNSAAGDQLVPAASVRRNDQSTGRRGPEPLFVPTDDRRSRSSCQEANRQSAPVEPCWVPSVSE